MLGRQLGDLSVRIAFFDTTLLIVLLGSEFDLQHQTRMVYLSLSIAVWMLALILPTAGALRSFHPPRSNPYHRSVTRLLHHASSSAIVSTTAIATSPEHPIVVLGAAGKTGRIIAKLLAEQEHHYVRAVSRRGTAFNALMMDADDQHYVSYATADVTRYRDVLRVTQGAAGVVWAVTSTGVKQGGGSAYEVDCEGAANVAKACIACHVPKLAFLSAACVTRPKALGSRVVNFLTQWTYGDHPWIDAKRAGEMAVRDTFSKADTGTCSYAIVRGAAALADTPPIDVSDLLVMQGDVYSAATILSRTNMAHCVVRALLMGDATDFVTFEVAPATRLYKNNDGTLFDLLNLPTLKQTSVPDLPKPLFHGNANSYDELLEGLIADKEMTVQYAWILNDDQDLQVPPVEFA